MSSGGLDARAGDGGRLSGARVVFVNWRDPWHSMAGGSERYAWETVVALRNAGAQVQFVTALDGDQLPREQIDGIDVIRRRGMFTFYPWALWRLLSSRLRGRAPDLVFDPANGIPVFSPLVLGRRTRIVLVIHHVHQEQFATYFPAPVAAFGRFLESWLMPRVFRRSTAVVVSPSTDEEIRRQLGWNGATLLIPNGNVVPSVEGLDLGALKVAGGQRRVIVFGRMVAHKRVDLAVRAFAAVRERSGGAASGLHLDIVGSGPAEPRARGVVAELGLEDCVTLHGFVSEDEKRRLLLGGWLNLCASDAEGWGQVVVEAAAHEVPTLARNVPGLRDSIVPGETGWLVQGETSAEQDPETVVAALTEGLATALDELEDSDRAQQIREDCRAWASEFTWERMHDRMVELAAGELGRPSGPISRADQRGPHHPD